mmetsp:Transcript_55600/g.130247  ORF Transcript_55600/g.130247 Transcript_55600/m.130247 type:complete len:351 (+) Transcript_55600:56-1108(+)
MNGRSWLYQVCVALTIGAALGSSTVFPGLETFIGGCVQTAANPPLRLRGGEGQPVNTAPEPFLLCTDLDDTLVGDKDALANFNAIWEELKPQGCKLVYNTGRSLVDYEELRKSWDLLEPDLFIGGCGSQMYQFKDGQPVPVAEWMERLKDGWKKELVVSLLHDSPRLAERYGKFSEKRESQGNDYMFSVRLPHKDIPLDQVKEDFMKVLVKGGREKGLAVQICAASVAYTAGSTVTNSAGSADPRCVFLDVLPVAAGKGKANVFARSSILSVPAARCIVAGDSGNDVSMFKSGEGERGIVVGNAKPELVDVIEKEKHVYASARNAAGIIEGLRHFGVLQTSVSGINHWNH